MKHEELVATIRQDARKYAELRERLRINGVGCAECEGVLKFLIADFEQIVALLKPNTRQRLDPTGRTKSSVNAPGT